MPSRLSKAAWTAWLLGLVELPPPASELACVAQSPASLRPACSVSPSQVLEIVLLFRGLLGRPTRSGAKLSRSLGSYSYPLTPGARAAAGDVLHVAAEVACRPRARSPPRPSDPSRQSAQKVRSRQKHGPLEASQGLHQHVRWRIGWLSAHEHQEFGWVKTCGPGPAATFVARQRALLVRVATENWRRRRGYVAPVRRGKSF